MGNVRARSKDEITGRKEEILQAARTLVEEQKYAQLSLALVAKRTSLSRPALYKYYQSAEAIYVDLLIREYAAWEEDLKRCFTTAMSKKAFCRALSDQMWDHILLLKLLAFHASSLESRCDEALFTHYFTSIQPYFRALAHALSVVFPHASKKDQDMFRVQFSIYCNSFFIVMQLPDRQISLMNRLGQYGELPEGKDICFEGLMLLAAHL